MGSKDSSIAAPACDLAHGRGAALTVPQHVSAESVAERGASHTCTVHARLRSGSLPSVSKMKARQRACRHHEGFVQRVWELHPLRPSMYSPSLLLHEAPATPAQAGLAELTLPSLSAQERPMLPDSTALPSSSC